MRNCVFCDYQDPVLQNDEAFAIYDIHPVNRGHMLVITRRHIRSFFETTNEERAALAALLDECQALLEEKYQPDGYNIGINDGRLAGQTIMHLHIHLIPRYSSEGSDPGGGVRRVISGRGPY